MLDDAIARMSLQLLPVEDLPAIAAEALANEFDSPALRILAGSDPAEPPAALWELFSKAVRELGLPFPSRLNAARIVLQSYLRDIAQRKISPVAGVKRILKDLQWPVGQELDDSQVGEALGIGKLLGNYYSYDDAASGRLQLHGRRLNKAQARDVLDRCIIEEAARLLQDNLATVSSPLVAAE